MQITIGYSTCPNDTFIFDAMVHQKIDTEGLTFLPHLADVEELNKKAFARELDVTKLSYFAYAHCVNDYVLLDAGSALGNNNGPLLISKVKIYPDEINNLRIAIPGKHTTANLLLSTAFPKATNKQEYLFSDIVDVIMSNEADAGLIIHETRFTYQEKGLKKIIDLGEWWETETKLPIPLGGIVVSRNLKPELQQKINRVMRRSVEFAQKNPIASLDYVRQYAKEMNESVMMQHIHLYVNDFTVDLGTFGKRAINTLFDKARANGVIPEFKQSIFIS